MNAIGQFAVPLVVIAFIMYRRTKRSIGFQKLSVRRMKVRLGFFAFAALMLLLLALKHPVMLIGYAAGVIGGLVLARYAERHFVTERRSGELFFRTHIWIESTVLALFLGRIVYRFIEVAMMGDFGAGMPQDPVMMTKDPITGGIVFIIISYYFAYYLFVIRSAKTIGSEAADSLGAADRSPPGSSGPSA